MIVMKFGGTSVQDAQTIDRERLPEGHTKISAWTNRLHPDKNRAPKAGAPGHARVSRAGVEEARKSLAHPEAKQPGPPTRAVFACWGGNAKPEGWVRHKTWSSPVGATQENPRPTATLSPSPKLRATTRQVSGHEFTRAVNPALAQISTLTGRLGPDNNRAPAAGVPGHARVSRAGVEEARKSLAHPEAKQPGPPTRAVFACWGGNAKPEGWVRHKTWSSPVGAAQENPRPTAALFPAPKLRATTRQVSGHEFTRAVQLQNISGFSPCSKPQGLKANLLGPHTARLKSCPDTCLVRGRTLLSTRSCGSSLAVLRVSVPPWWRLSR
jgi:hypothetical protein